MNTEKSQMTSDSEQDYGTIHSITNDYVDSDQKVEISSLKLFNLIKRVLLVLFVLGISVAVLDNCFTNAAIYQSLDSVTNSTNAPVCQTDACEAYADKLNSTMDFTVAPCDDFYQHVCGNWQPPMISHFGLQKEKAHIVVQLALEEKLIGSSKALAYIAGLFEECTDWTKRDQLGYVKPIRGLLKQVLGDDWSFVAVGRESFTFVDVPDKIDDNAGQQSISSVSQFEKHWNLWKMSKLLKENDNDQTDVDQWMDCYVEATLIKAPTLIRDIVFLLKDDDDHDEYGRIRIRLATSSSVDFGEKVLDSLYSDFVRLNQTVSKLIFDSESNTTTLITTTHALFEVLEFKLKLARMYKHRRQSFEYKGRSFSQLDIHSLERFNWTRLVNKLLNKSGVTMQVNGKDRVGMYAEHIDLIAPLTKLIHSTPIRVLKNVMALDILESSIVSKLLSTFEHLTEEQKQIPWFSWRRFMLGNDFERLLPLYTRLFIDYLGREKMQSGRERVIEMVHQTKATLVEMIKQNYTWLDESTRKVALERVDTVDAQISHSDWIFEDDALDEEFGFDDHSTVYPRKTLRGNFIGSYFNLIRIMESAKIRRTANGAVVEKRTPFPFVFYWTGKYSPAFNQLVISHALLTGPTFNLDYPLELNYGMVGSFIAHELLHIFDNHGRYIDSDLRLVDCWTDEDVQQFETRSQCFVRQYGQLVDQNTGIKVNEKRTLYENLADNGGVKLAYHVLEQQLQLSCEPNSTCTQTVSPFLAQYSRKQLFFLSFGLLYCSNAQYSSDDTHSPAKYRVNIALSNFDQFSQAFNCPVGSKMNPKDKCALW